MKALTFTKEIFSRVAALLIGSRINLLQIFGIIASILAMLGEMGLTPAAITSFIIYGLSLVVQRFFTKPLQGGGLMYFMNIAGIIVLLLQYLLHYPVFDLSHETILKINVIINTINIIIRSLGPIPQYKRT